MTDLSKLSVSLTKHGAHKIATVLGECELRDVLDNLWGTIRGVKIDGAQAKKNLSVDKQGNIPKVWEEAKARGKNTTEGLVLIAIISSHHELIEAMKASSDGKPFSGTLVEGKELATKAYTNFAHLLDEFGFATKHTSEQVSYNLEALFKIPGLNELALKLLRIKLKTAKWDGKNSIADELVSLGFHKVFSVEEDYFRSWLNGGWDEKELDEFFLTASDQPSEGEFEFAPGHNERKTGGSSRSHKEKTTEVNLLHNHIQNELYSYLVKRYGKNAVGSEQPTGQGTYIDVVVKTKDFCWFYEIKTASTVKACIRQALPQLLEYAFWKEIEGGVDKLIIVSELPITDEADTYIKSLRDMFNLPLYYEQFPIS